MNARHIVLDDEFIADLTAETLVDVMQADCGFDAAETLAEHLAESFTHAKDVRGAAEGVALELLTWLRPALFQGPNNTRPCVMYRHPDGQGTVIADPQNGLVVRNEVEGKTVRVRIGHAGLRALAAELVGLAGELEGACDE